MLSPTKYSRMPSLQGQDLLRVRAMFFKCLDWSRLLDWDILSCRAYLLSSCLGSDASSACPCEAQQTPLISPSRTKTTDAFQQLDLMPFHHQWGEMNVRGPLAGKIQLFMRFSFNIRPDVICCQMWLPDSNQPLKTLSVIT